MKHVENLMWFNWHPFPDESLKKLCEKANKHILLDSNILNKK